MALVNVTNVVSLALLCRLCIVPVGFRYLFIIVVMMVMMMMVLAVRCCCG